MLAPRSATAAAPSSSTSVPANRRCTPGRRPPEASPPTTTGAPGSSLSSVSSPSAGKVKGSASMMIGPMLPAGASAIASGQPEHAHPLAERPRDEAERDDLGAGQVRAPHREGGALLDLAAGRDDGLAHRADQVLGRQLGGDGGEQALGVLAEVRRGEHHDERRRPAVQRVAHGPAGLPRRLPGIGGLGQACTESRPLAHSGQSTRPPLRGAVAGEVRRWAPVGRGWAPAGWASRGCGSRRAPSSRPGRSSYGR